MKDRVNLTIDRQVVHRAKRVAETRNTSVSALVERLLRESVAEEQAEESEPFSARWGGKLHLADHEGERMERLTRKYGLR